jgi:Uma2 family endonuclease
MATTTEPRPTTVSEVSPYVFHDVSWDDYEAMLRIVGNRPIRVTYEQGNLEILSTTFGHAVLAHTLGRIADTLAEEFDIPAEAGGMTTLRRMDLARGAEPDQCFWFRETAARVRGKKRLDFHVDPPPDLVIEVDVTSSSLSRLPIFSALGVPEVWRFADDELRFLHRQADGSYQPRDSSLHFPFFTVAEAARFMEESGPMDKAAWIKSFRAYARDVLVPRARGGG